MRYLRYSVVALKIHRFDLEVIQLYTPGHLAKIRVSTRDPSKPPVFALAQDLHVCYNKEIRTET